MLRRTTYHFLSLLILSLWVISCQTTPDSVVQTLSLVEKCMEVAPDSALNLLKRIPNPDVLHGKAQADYSLLMTQAMDKNYTAKLTAIDNAISAKVAEQAKAGNYDVVLAKGVVLYGGTDITEAVKKAVK